jgi:hypothetical protein
MTDNNKKGAPAAEQYGGTQSSGARGFYYQNAKAASACLSGYKLPRIRHDTGHVNFYELLFYLSVPPFRVRTK